MRAKPKVARQIREEFDIYAFLAKWARTGLQLAIAGFVISLGYILYGIFSGVLVQSNADAAQVARFVRNLDWMGKVLAGSSLLGAVAFLVLTLGEFAFAILLGLIGAGLMFGMPVVVANNLAGRADPAVAGVINLWTKNAGMAILAMVALRILYEIVEQIRTGATRRQAREEQEAIEGPKKVKKIQKQGMWSPCWNLPYCHDAVREHCPAFKARRSCWRFGYGCNCDPGLIERLLRSGALDTAKGASRQTSTQKAQAAAYVRSDLQADAPVRAQERTIPCSKCPIYLDHQRQKFKIVNPIAVVATLALLAAAYKPLLVLYSGVISGISRVASGLTYGTRVNAGDWFNYLNITPIKVFFFIIVGLLALAYVLKFVEWLIFEKKV